jgi:hypothetical protein
MTTDLRDGLTRLAESTAESTAPSAVPPADLWRRGVRRRRRVRSVTALAAAAAVVVAMGVSTFGVDALRTEAPQPSNGERAGAVPDRLETPSRWLPTTSERGPIGPLAVIAGAEEATGWFGGSTNGVVGVSAGSGTYRFVDPPDLATDEEALPFSDESMVLSPDGRSLAYWFRQSGHADRIGGFAVYDTVTGDVVQHAEGGELGVYPDGLDWVGNDALVVTSGRTTHIRRDGRAGKDVVPRLWTPATDVVTELDRPFSRGWGFQPTSEGFVARTNRGLAFYDAATGGLSRTVRMTDVPGSDDISRVLVDPAATTAVGLEQSDGPAVRRLWVGRISADAVRPEPVRTGISMFDLLGWKDSGHVVVRAVVPGSDRESVAAYSVDVATGQHELLVREDRVGWGAFPTYATDLWAGPTVHRPGPDHVLDPRLRAAGAAALVLVLGGLVLRARRRRARA